MIHWDEFAAVVAVVAILFTLSGSTVNLLTWLSRQLLSILAPSKVQCGSLCWDDVLDGFLSENGAYSCLETDLTHDKCLESTFGKVFKTTWMQPQRASKMVPKPADLDLDTHYVRMDPKALRCFLLAHYEFFMHNAQPHFTFETVGTTLTAHYNGAMEGNGDSWAMKYPLTKKEAELLLEGYPPLYRSSYTIRSGEVDSPIRDHSDIDRGAWIVHCGLSNPSSSRSLQFHDVPQYYIATGDSGTSPYHGSIMQAAVERFGMALEKVSAAFPQNTTLTIAIELYKDWIDPKTSFLLGAPSSCYYYRPNGSIRDLKERGKAMFGRGSWPYSPGPHVRKLEPRQWQIAMGIFNHHGISMLNNEEMQLLSVHLPTIMQVAMRGLLRVMVDGEDSYSFHGGKSRLQFAHLPATPELAGHKYVYVRSCTRD
jgi:hypothetical protein